MKMRSVVNLAISFLFIFINSELFAQDDVIHWIADYDQAVAQATGTNKNIFAVFTSEHCHPCQLLKKHILTKPEIVQYVNERMIPLAIDIDVNPTLATTYRVQGVPATIIIRATKEEVDRFVGGDDSNEFADDYLDAIISFNEQGKTINELEETLRLDPNNPNIMLEIMKKYFSQALEQKAFEYKNMIENGYQDFFSQHKAEIYYEIAEFYDNDWDRRELAIPYLNEILQIQDADRSKAYYMLADIYFTTEKVNEGFDVLEKGLVIYPNDLIMNVVYLNECVDTKLRIDQGIGYGLAAVQSEGNNGVKAYLYYLIARLYEIKTNKPEAVRMIDKAIELDPEKEQYKQYKKILLES